MFPFSKKRSKLQLESGELEFSVPMPDDSTVKWLADLITIKLTCENLEQKHQLECREDKTLVPTQSFLEDVSTELSRLGCPRCNVSIARQVWIAASRQYGFAEKRFNKRLEALR
jgi:hypothetical protein